MTQWETLALAAVGLFVLIWGAEKWSAAQQPSDTGSTDAGTAGVGDIVSNIFGGNDQLVLAQTIDGEARNQSAAAQQGVGCVVRNRIPKFANYFALAGTYASICTAENQFSCWDAGDPNLPVIQAATEETLGSIYTLAGEIIARTLTDNTGGATFYHSDASLGSQPEASWGKPSHFQFTVQIGAFYFFKRIGVI